MASCSSSSFISPSSFNNDQTQLPKSLQKGLLLPIRRSNIPLLHIHSNSHLRKQFQSKCSNGFPLNAVHFQDDLSPTNEPVKNILKDGTVPSTEAEARETTISIIVVGASGDLAKKKIFPALFALFYEDCLPKHFTVFGYARSKLTDEELRNMISMTLTCRIDKRENCSDKMVQFLQRCFYHSGQYGSEENFLELDRKLKEKEGPDPVEFRLVMTKSTFKRVLMKSDEVELTQPSRVFK